MLDEKYLQIKLKNIRQDLEDLLVWNANNDQDKFEEYIVDIHEALYALKRKSQQQSKSQQQ